MGFHGYFLEFHRRTIREYFLIQYNSLLSQLQTYVYSVVYMASHDPSKYKFSTPTYIALYTTLLTAYYMSVSFVNDGLR